MLGEKLAVYAGATNADQLSTKKIMRKIMPVESAQFLSKLHWFKRLTFSEKNSY